MTAPRLLLFDDRRARRWAPFSLTRPVGELPFGALSLRERAERTWGLPCSGHVSRSALEGFDESGAPRVAGLDSFSGREAPLLVVSSRAVVERAPEIDFTVPARLTLEGITVGWVVPEGEPPPSDLWIRDPASASSALSAVTVHGEVLEHPWDVVDRNAARVKKDLEAAWPYDDEVPGAIRIGDDRVSLGSDAHVEPGVVLDTRGGPIRIEDGARVEGPARLEGPLWVGAGTVIFGGPVARSTIGHTCKIRGEIADCVLSPFVNKAHDGHLGHALVGRWVNLGAGTTNSDLKNNYGSVTVWTPDGDVNTGLTKVGCFLGDHVKTGIGTLLNTGTVVGAGSNVFGGAMPPVAVPPFSWGTGSALTTYRLDKFLETAERAMARRDVELSDAMRDVLTRAWELTAGQRPE